MTFKQCLQGIWSLQVRVYHVRETYTLIHPPDMASRNVALERNKSALLVIDMQDYCAKPGRGLFSDIQPDNIPPEHQYMFNRLEKTVIPNADRLLKAFRATRPYTNIIYMYIESLTKDSRDQSLDYKWVCSTERFPRCKDHIRTNTRQWWHSYTEDVMQCLQQHQHRVRITQSWRYAVGRDGHCNQPVRGISCSWCSWSTKEIALWKHWH